MKYRRFPIEPDRPISALGFGAASLSGDSGGYGFGNISDDEATNLVRQALDLGINLFDTAPIYGFGSSEQRLGRALKGYRSRAYVVSKCGVTWDNNKRVDINNSVATTEKMLNQSLKDLQTDCIDMYMIHWPDPRNDIRFTLEYLEKRREAGCIAALGLCNTNAEDLAKAKEITTILAIQEEYNVFVAPKKQEWLTEIESQGLGYMAWGTLDKGVLTGRVTAERKFEASDARSHAPWWKKEDRSNKFKAVTAFKKLIEDSEITLLDLAIHGALNPPAVTCALVGVRNSEQLVSATAALTHSVPEELIDLMGKIVREYIE